MKQHRRKRKKDGAKVGGSRRESVNEQKAEINAEIGAHFGA